ncbi:hypothetical protein LshimejAT787_0501320 [Lyophyllum shimeji]|uniref:DUF6534 domain-containing protein n=1 Tax=Lyophyllum shimeji TaxID=47721 RepID=A0A9P3PMY9_LYOSH|nr:hypothetical protein LshimejAT787_0501320 [Lyophyllum shimeji]
MDQHLGNRPSSVVSGSCAHRSSLRAYAVQGRHQQVLLNWDVDSPGALEVPLFSTILVLKRTMSEYATTLGGLLLGALLNTYFYGIVFVQNVAYYSMKFDDPYYVKALVVSLFCLNSVHTASLVYAIWVYAVQNYNNPHGLLDLIWPLPFNVLITTIVAFMVQTFLAYRILRLTQSRLCYGIVMLFTVFTLVAGLVCSGTIWRFNITKAALEIKLIKIWLAFEVGVDILITAILVAVLLPSRDNFHRTNTLINRVIRGAIQSGNIALLVIYPATQYCAIVSWPSAHLYSITIMDTLLVRRQLRELVRGNVVNTSVMWGLETWGGPASQSTDGNIQRQTSTQTQVSLDSHADHLVAATVKPSTAYFEPSRRLLMTPPCCNIDGRAIYD